MSRAFALCVMSVALLALAFVPAAEAAAVVEIEPGLLHTVDRGMDEGESLTYFWSADDVLGFQILDPDGISITSTHDDWYSDTFEAQKSGRYTFIWENDGSADSITLNYTLNIFGGIEEGLSALAIAAIVVAVIIIVVIVIVVLVVVVGGQKRAQQAPPAYPPPTQYAAQAASTGMCPSCGSQLDPQAAFCSRCGFRYR